MGRKIIHIDMDAFFASIEQRDNPELLGKPVAVGHGSDRGVVAAASYEARRFGVHSAMPSVVASRKCPSLIFVHPRFEVYKGVSAILMNIFREYTPLVEPLSIDEAFLDVTTNKKGIPSATQIALEIKNRIQEATGLTASAGISVNKFLAKIASDYRKPDGLFVIRPNEVLPFVEALPVEKFFGVGPRTSEKMHELGFFCGKDLQKADLQLLIRHFGKVGNFFHQVAHGIDQRPVIPHRVRKSVGIESTFLHDLEEQKQMLNALLELEDGLWQRIVRHGSFGKTITLKVKYSDFEQITRSQSFLYPISERVCIHEVVVELLQIANPTKKVRLLGVTISNFEKEKTGGSVQLTIDFD